MEQSSSTHVVIQTTRSTSIQSFCTKLLIRCHHHHVPPNPFTLLDTPLLREPTRLPPLALILYSDRTVQYRPQQPEHTLAGNIPLPTRGRTGIRGQTDLEEKGSAILCQVEKLPRLRKYLGTTQEPHELPAPPAAVPAGAGLNSLACSVDTSMTVADKSSPSASISATRHQSFFLA